VTTTTPVLIVLAPLLVFSAAAVVLAIVDLAEKRLPNAVIGPALIAVAVLFVLTSALTGLWWNLLWALAGSAGMFSLYLVIALIPGAMGMGDVKLAALIGLTLGWFGLGLWVVGVLLGFVVGGIVAIVALALRAARFKGSIPYGPSMLAGAVVVVVVLV
jgi:leader peptidase (prepilin peptidase)/N-methyltransferase